MTWRINPHKYNAKITKRDGYTFQSKREADRYDELKILEKTGAITDLKIHPRYKITVAGMFICTAVLDFEYWDWDKRNGLVYEDVKGKDTDLSRLKRKLLKALYKIDVVIIR